MENPSDFDFYVRFAKPLILSLPKINDRVLAAAWVKKLIQDNNATEKLKLDYLKLLLFVLQRKTLAPPFTNHPNNLETIPAFPKDQTLVDVARQILEKENDERRDRAHRNRKGEGGDYPPYISDFSADLLEYVAVQNIENFGVHGYYAISKAPLNTWYRVDKHLFPKAAKSMIEVSPGSPPMLGTPSMPELRERSPSPSISPPAEAAPSPAKEVAFVEPPPPAEEAKEEEEGAATEERSPPVSPPKRKESAKKSTIGSNPPSRPIGKIRPPTEDWEPPSWGSNLLEVKHVLEKGDIPSADEPAPATELLWSSQSQASPNIFHFSPPDFENYGMEQSPPSFLYESPPGVDSSPEAWPSAASLPYATPPYPRVTPPPPGKPTPPPPPPTKKPAKKAPPKVRPTRASMLIQKKTAEALAPPKKEEKKPKGKGKKAVKPKLAELPSATEVEVPSTSEVLEKFDRPDEVDQYMKEHQRMMKEIVDKYMEERELLDVEDLAEEKMPPFLVTGTDSRKDRRLARAFNQMAGAAQLMSPRGGEAGALGFGSPVDLGDLDVNMQEFAPASTADIDRAVNQLAVEALGAQSPKQARVNVLVAEPPGSPPLDDFEAMEQMVEEEMKRKGEDPRVRKKQLSKRSLQAGREQFLAMNRRTEAQMDELMTEEEKQRDLRQQLDDLYNRLQPDVPASLRSPPAFSRHPEIRALAAEMREPEDESETFVHGPEFFANVPSTTVASPRGEERSPLPFDHLDLLEDSFLPEDFPELVPFAPPTEEERKKTIHDIDDLFAQIASSSPALAGVPVTSPRASPIPQRVSHLDETPPDLGYADYDEGQEEGKDAFGLPLVETISPPRPQTDTKDVIRRKLFGSPKHPPLSPPIDAAALREEISREMPGKYDFGDEPYQRQVSQRHVVNRYSHRSWGLRPVEETAEDERSPSPPHGLTEEDRAFQEELKQFEKTSRGREVFKFPYKHKQRVMGRHSRGPAVSPVQEERLPPKTPPKVQPDMFDVPMLDEFAAESPPDYISDSPECSPECIDVSEDEDLLAASPPEEMFETRPVSPLGSPADPQAWYQELQDRPKQHYNEPYLRKVSHSHMVSRRSAPPGFDPISEVLEDQGEEVWEQRNRIAQKRYLPRKEAEKGKFKPRLSPLEEAFVREGTPASRVPAEEETGGPRRREIRKRLLKRRLDFDQPASPDESQVQAEVVETIVQGDRVLPPSPCSRSPVQRIEFPSRRMKTPPRNVLEGMDEPEWGEIPDISPGPSPRSPTPKRPTPKQQPDMFERTVQNVDLDQGFLEDAAAPEDLVFSPTPSPPVERHRTPTPSPTAAALARMSQEVKEHQMVPMPLHRQRPATFARVYGRLDRLPEDTGRERAAQSIAEIEAEAEREVSGRCRTPPCASPAFDYVTPPELRRQAPSSPPRRVRAPRTAAFKDMMEFEERPFLVSPPSSPKSCPAQGRVSPAPVSPPSKPKGLSPQALFGADFHYSLDDEELAMGQLSPLSPMTAEDVQKIADIQLAQLGSPSPRRRPPPPSPTSDEEFEMLEKLAHDPNANFLEAVAAAPPTSGRVNVMTAALPSPSKAKQAADAQLAALMDSPQPGPSYLGEIPEALDFQFEEKVTTEMPETTDKPKKKKKKRKSKPVVEYDMEALEDLGVTEQDLGRINLADVERPQEAHPPPHPLPLPIRSTSPGSPSPRSMYKQLESTDSKIYPLPMQIKGKYLPTKYKFVRQTLPKVQETQEEHRPPIMGWDMNWEMSPDSRTKLRAPDVRVPCSPPPRGPSRFDHIEDVKLESPPRELPHPLMRPQVHVDLDVEPLPDDWLEEREPGGDLFDKIERLVDHKGLEADQSPELLDDETLPSPGRTQPGEPVSPSQLGAELKMHQRYDPGQNKREKTIQIKGRYIPELSPIHEGTPPKKLEAFPTSKSLDEVMAEADRQYDELMAEEYVSSSPQQFRQQMEQYEFDAQMYYPGVKKQYRQRRPGLTPPVEAVEKYYRSPSPQRRSPSPVSAPEEGFLDGQMAPAFESPQFQGPTIQIQGPSPPQFRTPSPPPTSPGQGLDMWNAFGGEADVDQISPPCMTSPCMQMGPGASSQAPMLTPPRPHRIQVASRGPSPVGFGLPQVERFSPPKSQSPMTPPLPQGDKRKPRRRLDFDAESASPPKTTILVATQASEADMAALPPLPGVSTSPAGASPVWDKPIPEHLKDFKWMDE